MYEISYHLRQLRLCGMELAFLVTCVPVLGGREGSRCMYVSGRPDMVICLEGGVHVVGGACMLQRTMRDKLVAATR